MQHTQATALSENNPPLEWMSACSAQADREEDAEAKAAFQQLAEEFQTVAEEIEGLVATFNALMSRKGPG